MESVGQDWKVSPDSIALLRHGRIVDEAWYRERAGLAAAADPVAHYLAQGWRSGNEPNAGFPGQALQPYFDAAGLSGPPALTWQMLRLAGWALPATWAEAQRLADIARRSDVFDAPGYARRIGAGADAIDPALHYVLVGERLGIKPGTGFDPAYYAERNPDVAASGMNWLVHFVEHGRAEGRRGVPAAAPVAGKATPRKRPNVLLVVHEASRTGAPILGWNVGRLLAAKYNLYTCFLGDGALVPAFDEISVATSGPFLGANRNEVDVSYALRSWAAKVAFEFAIVNSAEARIVIQPLACAFVPTLFLVHEFAAYVSPQATLAAAFDWASEVVFPAPLVARAALKSHPVLRLRETRVLPQGMSIVPGAEVGSTAGVRPAIAALARLRQESGAFIVLGAGLIQLRKGVDFFIATAAAVLRRSPARPVRFLWVGQGYVPDKDMSYAVYLREQLERSGVEGCVQFEDEVEDLGSIYALADAFLLSSRLDPLPNVCIDAANHGIPIVCFREATGMADILMEDALTAGGVVDHLDPDAAARVLLALLDDEPARVAVAAATRSLAARRFDMQTYVAALSDLGGEAARRMAQRRCDAEALAHDPAFDQEMFIGPAGPAEPRVDSILRYLTLAAARGDGDPRHDEQPLRRPAPGFDPRVYARVKPELAMAGVDAFADFVRGGCPPGPWQADVMRLDGPLQASSGAVPKVALHAHLYYPELVHDLLWRLRASMVPCDLFVSTDAADKATMIEAELARYLPRKRFTIRVVANRGRNFGPLLTELRSELSAYDLFGHVHGKKSGWASDGGVGDSWRQFLWETLLGGTYPAIDVIVDRFARSPKLGLVFPADPHLLGWGSNRAGAEALANRIRPAGGLPFVTDFPNGGMFWARPAALRPLFDLNLAWTDYPDEPVAYDGTILHALERMPAVVAAWAGYDYAVTHAPGVSWAP